MNYESITKYDKNIKNELGMNNVVVIKYVTKKHAFSNKQY